MLRCLLPLSGLASIVVGTALWASAASADSFTQNFPVSTDLDFKSIRFSPDASADYYEACTTDIEQLPVSTVGATVVNVPTDGFVAVTPGFSIDFYGQSYSTVYICENGYVSLGFGDVESIGSFANHFMVPRVSAFFTDVAQDAQTKISWKTIGSRLIITYRGVVLKPNPSARFDFQVELYSSGGVVISFLDLPIIQALTGLSEGNGIPAGFTQSDLSSYAPCESECLNAVVDTAAELNKIYTSPPLSFLPDEMDLDINGIPDVLNLQLLEMVLRRGSAFGHCQALAAWENNLGIYRQKAAVLPNNVFSYFTRDEFVRACAGMATLGDGRFGQKVLRLMGVNINLNIGRDETDDSGEPFTSWSGDMDLDGACNRGEFISSASFGDFLLAAFDPTIAIDGGECFDGIFQFPEGEGGSEGQVEGQDPDAPLCSVDLEVGQVVPSVNGNYNGRAVFTKFGESVLITVTHNVPQPATVTIYRGNQGNVGVAYMTVGGGISPAIATITQGGMDFISTGFYVEVEHVEGNVRQAARGQIECAPIVTEGELQEDGEATNEGDVEGSGGEGSAEGNIEGDPFEGEAPAFTGCSADLKDTVLPSSIAPYSGVAVVSNLGATAQVVIFHSIPSPTYAEVHLGKPGQAGPKLFSIPAPLQAPIILQLPIEQVRDISRGAYVVLGYSGFSKGEIRADLVCENDAPDEGEIVISNEYHSADLNVDKRFQLSELLRVVQFFNLGEEFGCADAETGYDVGSTARYCTPADFDFQPRNWHVELAEVLRIIQIYNAGGYLSHQDTEDSFSPYAQPLDGEAEGEGEGGVEGMIEGTL